MSTKTKPQKALVLITGLILVVASAIVAHMSQIKLGSRIDIETEGLPTIGYPKAVVQVVVVEEPKCSDCKIFNETIFPKIKSEFIETNKIQYSVILVSFLPDSMPAANALFCTYYQDPQFPDADLFFTYLDYIYRNAPPEHVDWAHTDELIELAKKASDAIDLKMLKSCINKDSYRHLVSKNTYYAKKLMGGIVSTPTLYVDGVKVDELTLSNVRELIKRSLRLKGVEP